jgi:crotonobetainyl-CoA:carnitine CoA-transferase CaiB-like acyl-CoA transferase
MLRISELPDFSAFRDRKVFREYKHPAISDSFLMENRPTAFSGIPDPDLAPAPLIAQHTAEILKERLGLSDEQIVELVRAGIVEVESTEQAMDPSPMRPS